MAINKEGAAFIHGLFEYMIEKIPKAQRDECRNKMQMLVDKGLIPEVDLSEGADVETGEKPLTTPVVRKQI